MSGPLAVTASLEASGIVALLQLQTVLVWFKNTIPLATGLEICMQMPANTNSWKIKLRKICTAFVFVKNLLQIDWLCLCCQTSCRNTQICCNVCCKKSFIAKKTLANSCKTAKSLKIIPCGKMLHCSVCVLLQDMFLKYIKDHKSTNAEIIAQKHVTHIHMVCKKIDLQANGFIMCKTV